MWCADCGTWCWCWVKRWCIAPLLVRCATVNMREAILTLLEKELLNRSFEHCMKTLAVLPQVRLVETTFQYIGLSRLMSAISAVKFNSVLTRRLQVLSSKQYQSSEE